MVCLLQFCVFKVFIAAPQGNKKDQYNTCGLFSITTSHLKMAVFKESKGISSVFLLLIKINYINVTEIVRVHFQNWKAIHCTSA